VQEAFIQCVYGMLDYMTDRKFVEIDPERETTIEATGMCVCMHFSMRVCVGVLSLSLYVCLSGCVLAATLYAYVCVYLRLCVCLCLCMCLQLSL
jgi:hypothetical protein